MALTTNLVQMIFKRRGTTSVTIQLRTMVFFAQLVEAFTLTHIKIVQ
jgi:hypothetical protein